MPTPVTTATRQFGKLVLAPVDPDKLHALRDLLGRVSQQTIAAMQGRPVSQAILPFHAMESVHYARLVLIEHQPRIGPMLAFATDYDGLEGEQRCSESRAYERHLDELLRHAGDGLDRIFQCCRGYRAGQLAAYFSQHDVPASTFYTGACGRSRNQILWEAELRRRVDAILDEGSWTGAPPEAVRQQVLQRLVHDGVAIPSFPEQPDLKAKTRAKLLALGAVALGVAASATFGAWLLFGVPPLAFLGYGALLLVALAVACVARFRHLEKTDAQFQPDVSQQTHEQLRVASTDENLFLQNQLTHLVPIKPGPLRWLLIRIVFYVLQLNATNKFNKGKLGSIPSIHFARWVLIPKRGVLFFSNFDNSWQSYLGDFIDKASSGLTAVWSNTVQYPRTKWLLTAGSRDAGRFLAWTRHHQIPTQVWYCAYPGLSIVNVNSNTEIRRGLASPESLDAATWLFRLRAVDRLDADRLFSDDQTREPPLSLDRIQGIILRGYGHMPEARYLLFRVQRATPELLTWIGELPLTSAAAGGRQQQAPEPLLNIAFSHRGLRALGVEDALCQRFSTAFVQGSDDEYRARINGDVGDSAPSKWEWGSSSNPVDLVLLVYAKSKAGAATLAERYAREGEARGLQLIRTLEGTTLHGRKEHFGFRDGIGQPAIAGCGGTDVEEEAVAAGEFLLGHSDGYGNRMYAPATSSGFNFGHNGSYLVFRQLEQNVEAFWRYCAAQSGPAGAVTVAAKMVGRWPSGASLVRHPDRDPNQTRFEDEDNFSYLANDEDNDRYGARCPFGAHIRRANPRDWDLGADRDESRKLSNLHRIVRRGRPYGPPLRDSMSVHELIEKSGTGVEAADAAAHKRGLQFLCFNASIDRQFEFIQQQWCNNPHFAGLDSGPDPLLGFQQPAAEAGTATPSFAVQSDVKQGLKPRCTEMQNFVRVVGSTYFFMPSISAVKLLGNGLARLSASQELESPPPDEQLHIDSLIESLREKMKKDHESGRMLRGGHPKMHGCIKARFKIEDNLAPELKVGLFAQPGEYRAWLRFSNQSGTVLADAKKDIRGAAIKLMGVSGAKLLDGEEHCKTHDFILVSHDAFVTKDAAEFSALVKALRAGKRHLLGFLLTHPRVARNVLRSLQRHTSPLEINYFSVVPYLLGTRAVKYTLRPSSGEPTPIARKPNQHYLREALKERLNMRSASFDFMVQVQGDPKKMPIEDPSVAWKEADAEFRKVATLEIPPQDFDTPDQQVFGDNLSFNPWRCLPEHRPLGGINRARRQVYRALSRFRHDRNAAPAQEPSDWEIPAERRPEPEPERRSAGIVPRP